MRFSIRDLIWLSVVVAMGVGWFLDHAAGTWYRRVADAKLQLATGKLNDLGWAVKTYPNGREFSVEPIYRAERSQ